MGTWIVRLGVAGAVLFVVGPLLASLGILPPIAGFMTFALGGILSLVTLIVGLIGLALGKGGARGVIVAGVVTAIFVAMALPGRSVPRINDITTDTAVPPEFVKAQTLPGNQGRDLKYPGPEFASQQQGGYPDLAGLRMTVPPDEAFKKVEAAAKSLPNTEITAVDTGRHSLEGVSTSRLFRFKDDFVIEVRPDSGGSVVHMRSKSRVGKGDVGANAARIRAVFAQLR